MPTLIQSVSRASAILDLLADNPIGCSVKEVAEKTGLNISTAHHLVNTLEATNYIYRLADGSCRLGAAIPRLYAAFLLSGQPDAYLLEVLDTLAQATRETTYLNNWQNGDIAVLAIHESPQALRIGGLHVGFRGNAHARAGGKAMLAFLPPTELDRYLAGHPPRRLTANTLVEPAAIKTHLDQVVRQGYAIDGEEFAEGACCVAAPIFSADGRAVAALSVSVPAKRFDDNCEQLIRLVLEASHRASAGLGYRSA